MVHDWQTNRLLVSDRLEVDWPTLFGNLRSIFPDMQSISGTSDIWCQDFMPIQLDADSFCQFTYQPDYLRDYEHLVTPPDKCRLPFMKYYDVKPIVLDGGNVVASSSKVILTD